jgi:hypothetical protein
MGSELIELSEHLVGQSYEAFGPLHVAAYLLLGDLRIVRGGVLDLIAPGAHPVKGRMTLPSGGSNWASAAS